VAIRLSRAGSLGVTGFAITSSTETATLLRPHYIAQYDNRGSQLGVCYRSELGHRDWLEIKPLSIDKSKNDLSINCGIVCINLPFNSAAQCQVEPNRLKFRPNALRNHECRLIMTSIYRLIEGSVKYPDDDQLQNCKSLTLE
jgi:hypothetical protein